MSNDKKISRRNALKGLAAAAAATTLGPLAAGCRVDDVAGALENQIKRTGPLTPEEVPIDHVVVVMMENRSFDHYFGSLTLDEKRTNVEGLTADLFNNDANGNKIYPVLVDDAKICVEDPDHDWEGWDVQFGDGKMDGFVTAHLDRHGRTNEATRQADINQTAMTYFNRKKLPFLYSLADDFTLCDHWFCSVRGPTWPNRWYLHGAQSAGITSNDTNGDYSFPMIYDRIREKGLSWQYYYTDLPFLALAGKMLSRNKEQKPLQSLKKFFDDAKNGTLPTYSMVDPGFALNDDHPPHHTLRGQQFLSSVYHALAASPQWERTLLVITYDENGGFYDHVPPPKVKDNFADKGFDQLGFRVPSIVAGPYVKQGVSSTVYDHTSVLAFLEWKFGMKPLTLRDANANNLTDVLDADRIRNRQPRKAPIYATVNTPPDIGAECEGGGFAPPIPHDLHTAANMGFIPPELDLRSQRAEILRWIDELEKNRFR